MGLNLNLINKINDYILGNFKIDYTFLNIVNKKNMILRLKKRKKLNRYDEFNNNFYKKVQNGFLKLAKNKKKNYLIIDSNLEIDFNKNRIIKRLRKLSNESKSN